MYTILDVETTGGSYNEEGITEIAIYKFDGEKIVDQFISLVNPERPIQPFVQNLTGITPKMVKTAPKFFELAKRIIEITENTIFIAHNVSFDYRIIKTEFKRLGFDFVRPTLDTVELSKALIPGLASYSLGKLCTALGIPMAERHRAAGDARATVQLFELLMQKDSKKSIIQASVKHTHPLSAKEKMMQLVENIPHLVGVYYLHNAEGTIIHIGKAINLALKIRQLLASKEYKTLFIRKETEKISFTLTGNELLAAIKETHETAENQPSLNIAKKRSDFPYGLFLKSNPLGYKILVIQRLSTLKIEPLVAFDSLKQAQNYLFALMEKHQLCPTINSSQKKQNSGLPCQAPWCLEGCAAKESTEIYNQKVTKAEATMDFIAPNVLLIDQGRTLGEKSFIWIQDQVIQGYGYYTLHHQIKEISTIQKIMVPVQETQELKMRVKNHYARNKFKEIIFL